MACVCVYVFRSVQDGIYTVGKAQSLIAKSTPPLKTGLLSPVLPFKQFQRWSDCRRPFQGGLRGWMGACVCVGGRVCVNAGWVCTFVHVCVVRVCVRPVGLVSLSVYTFIYFPQLTIKASPYSVIKFAQGSRPWWGGATIIRAHTQLLEATTPCPKLAST